jgi:arylsulfatase A-like enzyme
VTPRLAPAFLATALVAGALACRGEIPPEPAARAPEAAPLRRVFLVTVDTLRADHLSWHGYGRDTAPRLAAIAARGVVFERAIAQWPKTGASFASLWSGRYPQTTGLTHAAAIELPADLPALPAFFADQGFATAAVISNPVLTHRLGWSRGFGEYLETWGDGPLTDDPVAMRPLIDARRVNALALPLLERLAAREKIFVWIHYSDPHGPYLLPEGVANPFLGDDLYRAAAAEQVPRHADRERHLGKNRERRFYVAQYDANVRVADEAIGALWDRVGALGLFENALWVFASDHGEGLGEHGSWFEHGPTPYNETAHVPLVLVASEGVAPRRIAEPVELIDLFPTLRDLVAPGAEIPGLEGRSLAPALAGAPVSAPARAFSEAGQRRRDHFRSLQDGRYKLIWAPDPADLPARAQAADAWQLYDLANDPGEQRDLLRDTAPPAELRALRATLLAWAKTPPAATSDEEAAARDREVRKALRALGYVQ